MDMVVKRMRPIPFAAAFVCLILVAVSSPIEAAPPATPSWERGTLPCNPPFEPFWLQCLVYDVLYGPCHIVGLCPP